MLSDWLNSAGHNSIHTLDLPDGNRTPDIDISRIAEREERIVVTKDSDFVDSFLLNRSPQKLLLISTGNIDNRGLERLFVAQVNVLIGLFSTHDFIELQSSVIVIHY